MAGKAPAPAGAAASSKAVGAPAGASAGAIRRRAGAQTRKQSTMNFYTDDSPGMKLPPVMVIVGSVIFILIVTMLHVVGKITK